MWALLSTRVRTWLAVAVLVPIIRAVLRQIAARRPGSPMAARLNQTDQFLGRFGKQGKQRRRRR